jgi:Amt family ammonium transporter
MAVLIPWGSGADRLRLSAGWPSPRCWPRSSFLCWRIGSGAGAGWPLGVNFSLGAGFLDGGGAATVHVLGGICALAVVWIAGPRKGKFPKEGLATAMPGHNAVYVSSAACWRWWAGWPGTWPAR